MNLKSGSRGNDVAELQQYLKSRGLYSGKIDGIFGPKTDSAVKAFQQSQGIKVDGIVGPITRSKMQGSSSPSTTLNVNNPAIQAAIKKDPRLAKNLSTLQQTGDISLDAIIASMESGEYSGLPWDAKTVKKELDRQLGILSPYYDEMQDKAEMDLTDTLGQARRDFENYLSRSSSEFKSQKEGQDVDAANKGVLFSSGRVQKLNNLKTSFDEDQAYKRASLGSDISKATRDFQYQFGSKAARGLSDYFKLGSNTYDAMSPGGSVGSGGLSSVYNPNSTDFYGTNNTAKRSAAIGRAASILKNKSNKLMPYGSQYQI